MPEERIEVTVLRVDYSCDSCGNKMLPTGMTLPVAPVRYVHECRGCELQMDSVKRYPVIEYQERC